MQVQPFNPLTIPISGTNLVEASAGTGKTYGIAALFTRLIVLEKMPVESVLVVTFTNAATAELKTRLRARLDDVLSVLENAPDAAQDSDGLDAYCAEHHEGDAFLAGLLKAALQQESRVRLIVRLKAAIGRFDNAAIYTIHGFCQRLLRDYAFFCQAPFDVELTEDALELLLDPAQDFWRENVSHNPLWARLVFKHKLTPEKALPDIKSFIGRPYLVFRRPEDDLEQAEQALAECWQKIRAVLPELAQTFWAIYPALNGNKYRKDTFQKVFSALEEAAQRDTSPPHHEKLSMFAAASLEEFTKKGHAPDQAAYTRLEMLARLGQCLDSLAEAEQNALIRLQADMLQYIANALEMRKKSRRERGFDDLLLDVYRALTEGAHSRQLAQAVAAVWQAALIDEFQDTDPLQYAIFERLFIRQSRPLFLVGDPKQAIYSFRGADIYAYMQAVEQADAHYTLATNFRSHAKLINGIGALFKQKTRPFVLDSIHYADVAAARSTGRLNPPQTAVTVRWLGSEENGGSDNKDVLRSCAADYCADEIAAALNDAATGRLNYQKGGSPAVPLQSGQIAVLVRTHNEGKMVAQALKRRNIQSVLLQRESVFASEEAEALSALLAFWLQPQRSEILRFVLGGVLFRYTAAMLYELNRDEAALLSWINSAQTAAMIWQQHGIYAAMQHFAAEHGIESGLLSRGSARSLTNYHQIIERLAEEDEQSRSPSALRQWLDSQIQTAKDGAQPKGENNLLRLESDENLVKIVTMHAAKGLQYPLVYCPFVWDSKENSPKGWQILHRTGRAELLHEQQLDEADSEQLADEHLSENLRLLYVALTRAEERLVIYAAYCSSTPDNTLAYLLEGGAGSRRADTAAAYAAAKKEKTADAMLKNNWLRFIANVPADTDFNFTDIPPEPASYRLRNVSDGLYRAAEIPPRPFEFIRHTSFTGLSRHTRSHNEHSREELQPALDGAEAAAERHNTPPESVEPHSIHMFPRGAGAGVCLHEILETFDFGTPAAEQSGAAAAALERYGFKTDWLPAVNTMLNHVRHSPLAGKTALADIPATRRLAEMGFTLFMHDFKLSRLQQWFAQTDCGLSAECAAAAKLLDFHDVKGFLNGFIDMVCQNSDGLVSLIDYKSNHLGFSAADYTQAAMSEAVAHHHYYLQALIYAVAAARYFAARKQPLHTIAVRYLFLRGLDGKGGGVWSWDIAAEHLQEWL